MNLSKLTKARKLLSEVFQENYYQYGEDLLWISNLLITMGNLDNVIRIYKESPDKKKGNYIGENQVNLGGGKKT